MKPIQKTLLTLIKSALTGEKYCLPENCNLQSVFDIAVEHNVANMAYYGAVNCGISTSSAEMAGLFGSVCKRMVLGEKQMRELKTLFELFDANDIDYMPLKGAILKSIYPKPDMRTMGDADILIRVEQYEKIEPIMRSQGFDFIKDSVNELVWNKKGALFLELHRYLVAPSHKDLFNLFGDGWKRATLCKDSKIRYEMSPEDTFLFLFIHFAKHYRSGGIGIRQAVDLWVYRKKETKLNEKYIKEKLVSLKMYEFYNNISEMLEVWFDDKENSQMSDFLTDYIFSSGNFGTRDNNAAAKVVRDSKTSGSIQKSFIQTIFKTIFLPYKAMCRKYSFLEKAPVLLPVMWIVRAADSIFIKRKKIKDYHVDKKAMDKANEFSRALEYVGADFDFDE